MHELGKKNNVLGVDQLIRLDISGRPKQVPILTGHYQVICGYDQGLGERLFVCESLEDMQELYDACARGGALQINWYTGEDPGFITFFR